MLVETRFAAPSKLSAEHWTCTLNTVLLQSDSSRKTSFPIIRDFETAFIQVQCVVSNAANHKQPIDTKMQINVEELVSTEGQISLTGIATPALRNSHVERWRCRYTCFPECDPLVVSPKFDWTSALILRIMQGQLATSGLADDIALVERRISLLNDSVIEINKV